MDAYNTFMFILVCSIIWVPFCALMIIAMDTTKKRVLLTVFLISFSIAWLSFGYRFTTYTPYYAPYSSDVSTLSHLPSILIALIPTGITALIFKILHK